MRESPTLVASRSVVQNSDELEAIRFMRGRHFPTFVLHTDDLESRESPDEVFKCDVLLLEVQLRDLTRSHGSLDGAQAILTGIIIS
jgi:hypothetical protein